MYSVALCIAWLDINTNNLMCVAWWSLSQLKQACISGKYYKNLATVKPCFTDTR